MSIKRREFLAGVGATFVASQLRATGTEKMRAVVIGHTGKGEYGHGLDMVFANLPNVELVGLADPVEAGRAKAAARCKPLRLYADWREMLDKEKPNFVSIAPRMTGERMEMLPAALSVGAHVICEKPFVRTPADGDQVLALAKEKNLKIAVTHQMRLAPSIVHLKKKIDAGLIGDLVEMNAYGKEDKRAGGEDMAVLGIHMFDQMRLWAGDPRWCSARVLEKGHDATMADVKTATEDLGPILGSDINAQFSFDNGVIGNFTSRAAQHDEHGHWGIELVGTKGIARIAADMWPFVWIKKPGKWDPAGRTDQWVPLDDDPGKDVPASQRTHTGANRRLVDDWLLAIAENREPVCSGYNAARAVEMSHAVWRAALSGTRVPLWLKERGHALTGV